MRIAIAQLDPTVGDVEGNLERLRRAAARIAPGEADLLVTPELFLAGYPPRDLLLHAWFVERLERAEEAVLALSRERPDLGFLVGTVQRADGPGAPGLYNAAVLVHAGSVLGRHRKRLLPTYDVFDESRYFRPGPPARAIPFRGSRVGVAICEDAWNDPSFAAEPRYPHNPIEELVRDGATLIVNPSASPFHRRKQLDRFERFSRLARAWALPSVFVGQVGANDELIFDGHSLAVDASGRPIASLTPFEEEVRVVDTAAPGVDERPHVLAEQESIRRALVLGVRDYVRKCGFDSAVLGLSGGVDSALTACIAVDALGPDRVRGVTMPMRWSSRGSVDDSLELSRRLGIRCDVVPIHDVFDAFQRALAAAFEGRPADVTEENLQARIRGTILMSYSNKLGALLLTTGNKSELAVGYCTLYGDMSGGLAVISDLLKTSVYRLAEWYNRAEERIPAPILRKAPSAELRPGQKDQDTLPPYEILDAILERYIERQQSAEEIVDAGYDAETVRWVIRAVDRNEYKRRQAPPGLRVTPKAFGTGRRMPIAARF
ncbi:MAG: NAD+ synthase [Acidobacteria bacterium]|nr:MAG: NAD+ synthase [Acidobacteriota bacterium]